MIKTNKKKKVKYIDFLGQKEKEAGELEFN